MSVFLAILSVVFFTCLIILAAMHPATPTMTRSEAKRRAAHTGTWALEARRLENRALLSVLLRTARAVVLVLCVASAMAAYGWGWGIVMGIGVAVIYPSIARLSGVRQLSQRVYMANEARLLTAVERGKKVLAVLREPSISLHDAPRRIYSHEDLAELVQNSHDVIGKDERQLLESTIAFFGTTVSSVMTPRSVIKTINKAEFLGPLVLDELHALGHSRLPVIAEDLNHVVGILHLRDLLSLDIRRSTTAEKAMEQKVYYIHQDDTLEHALAAFLKTRHHLFIVINETRETVGLLTLEDVIEALIGRRIVDEDDIHADLRAVAAQAGKANNNGPGRVDL